MRFGRNLTLPFAFPTIPPFAIHANTATHSCQDLRVAVRGRRLCLSLESLPMEGINKNPSVTDLRVFGITMLAGFGVIGGLLAWKWGLGNPSYALWSLGAFFFVVELALPTSLGKTVYIVWMSMAFAMGKVMIPLFLTILYFTLLIPFTLIRLKDPLRFKLKSTGTYWEPHKNHEPTIDRMMRPY